MNKIVKILLSLILSVTCFAADLGFINSTNVTISNGTTLYCAIGYIRG